MIPSIVFNKNMFLYLGSHWILASEKVTDIYKNMSKTRSILLLERSFTSTNYIFNSVQVCIIPELGSTLGYCIEASSALVKTAEDLYALKTLLQRAGQYL